MGPTVASRAKEISLQSGYVDGGGGRRGRHSQRQRHARKSEKMIMFLTGLKLPVCAKSRAQPLGGSAAHSAGHHHIFKCATCATARER